MLGQDELTKAIAAGQKAAEACGSFCRLGATLEDGRYICHHNGVGSRDTDRQVVHANPTLTMNTEQLAAHLAAWIKGLHGHGDRRDLNAAMSDVRHAGGPVTGGTAYLVGESGPELFVPNADGGEACITWTTAGQPAFQRLQFVPSSDGVIVPHFDIRASVLLLRDMRQAADKAALALRDLEGRA